MNGNNTVMLYNGVSLIMATLDRQKILDAAQTAPSGDNCQPWIFEWQGDALNVHVDVPRAEHYYNIHNYATVLSIGMVVELVRISAEAQGFQCAYQVNDAHIKNNSTKPWCQITFSPMKNGTSPTTDLHEVIHRRYVDRRIYAKTPLDAQTQSKISGRSGDWPKTSLNFCKSITKDFLNYIKHCDYLMAHRTAPLRDISTWLRMSLSAAEKSRDGIYWKQLDLDIFAAFMFSLFARWPLLPQILWYFGYGMMNNKYMCDRLRGSGALYCIAVKDLTNDAFIECGRHALRVWLQLNQAGYAVQPLTLYGSFPSLVDQNRQPADFTATELEFFKNGLQLLRQSFGLSENEYPFWIFRCGKAPAFRPELKAYRFTPRLLSSKV